MAASGLIGIVTTRLIIQHFGVEAYAQYGLLVSITALVPFADLGMSAVVINAVAGSHSPSTDETVRRTLTSSLRILVGSAFVLVALAAVFTITGLWATLLGGGLQRGGQVAALVCVVIFAVTLPLGVGQRILTGLGKNHLQIAAQSLASPFVFLGVLILVLTATSGGNLIAILPYLAGALVASITLILAGRRIRPQLRHAATAVPHPKASPGVKTLHVAWPMLAQMVALPIAMQTDRLLLSHLGTPNELAQYNLGAQLFGMIIQTIAAAGIALWPIFAKARSESEIKSPNPLALGFLGGGLALAVALSLLLPWVVPLISGGRISLDIWLVLGYVVLVAGQAAKYPLGMYMTDPAGLRFQVAPIVLMVPLNLGLSWALIGAVGAAGPVIGSAISVAICQVAPDWWYVKRDIARRRAQVSASRADRERPSGDLSQ